MIYQIHVPKYRPRRQSETLHNELQCIPRALVSHPTREIHTQHWDIHTEAMLGQQSTNIVSHTLTHNSFLNAEKIQSSLTKLMFKYT